MLMRKHRIPVFDGLCVGQLSLLWRHGYPSKKTKLIAGKVINIFIIRDLDDWLISMYHTPYYLYVDKTYTLGVFLTAKQKLSGESDVPINYKNNKVLNYTDENKTIFDIRYNKIKSYLRFFNKNENVVIVRLKYLQNEQNCIHFMQKLSEKYGLNVDEFHGSINEHTKTNEPGLKNRVHPIKITPLDRCIINMFKDKDIEDYVTNLTFEMK
jgi:hypothetical protein